jgi:transposase
VISEVKEAVVRSIGLDVHRDFCEVAICESGSTRRAGRIASDPQTLELFASSLSADDQVAMEATSNALAIARILEGHVARVVLAHPRKVRVIAEAKVKTDQIDARVLAELLDCDYLPAIWIGDERSRSLRRQISQRRALVKRRTALKNEVSAALMRTLAPRSPASDPFGAKGRAWLSDLESPADERATTDARLRQLDFLAGELAHLERLIARRVRDDEDVRRLMTIPGIDMITATTLVAVIGDIHRFPTSGKLVGYLGLHPTVKQSGNAPARHGRLAKDGSAAARHALTEAAWAAAKTPGPLHAFAQRVGDRRGRQVATIAVARKLAVLAWNLLTRGEDYAFQRPSLVRRKLRHMDLLAGAQRAKPGPKADPVWNTATDAAEKRLALQAETAYKRLVADWQSTRPKVGASATPERASQRPSKGKAARQATSS